MLFETRILLALALVVPVAEADVRRPSSRVTPSPRLVISEIMYHPAEGGAEFIELFNNTDLPRDLSGFSFDQGISYVFPPGTVLEARAYLVLISSESEFVARYPGVLFDGIYEGRLSNGGETITLSDHGQILVSLTYSDQAPWQRAPDGNGYSLVLRSADAAPDDPSSWMTSSWLGGSPGHDDTVCFDPSQALFAPQRVLNVSIEIAEQDWHDLRNQGRNRVNLFTGDCHAQPFVSPFTFFPATVTVDGVTLGQVGVRKKGFIGSLSRSKPALKLKFDEYVAGQRLLGVERLTLNNAIQDPSYLNQCFAAAVFAAAGVASPRCNFAHVTVNGEELGLYVNLESIKKPFLARSFLLNDGNLYEGNLSDFTDDFVTSFERKNNPDDPARTDLESVVDALQVGDDQLVAALQSTINLDAFMTFWATEVLLGHWDGYTGNTNNFFVYRNPTDDLFYFIPWGVDQILTDEHPYGTSASTAGTFATSLLPRRLFLYPPTRQLYTQRVFALLDAVWDEEVLLAEIDRLSRLITPYLKPEEVGDNSLATSSARAFVRQRRAQLTALLQPEPPPWTQPLREPFCFPFLGDLSVEFTTTWGTYPDIDPTTTGSGSVTGSALPSAPIITVTAVAGPAYEPELSVIEVLAGLRDGTYRIVYVLVETQRLGPATAFAIDVPPTEGLLFEVNSEGSRLIGLLGEGAIQLDQVGLVSGSVVTGTIDALVYQPTF